MEQNKMQTNRPFQYRFTCERCGTVSPLHNAVLHQGEALVTIGRRDVRRGQMGGIVRSMKKGKSIYDEMLGKAESIQNRLAKNISRTMKAFQSHLSSGDRYIGNPFLAGRFNELFTSHVCSACGHKQSWYPVLEERYKPLRSARAYAAVIAIPSAFIVFVASLLQDRLVLWNLYLAAGCVLVGALCGGLSALFKNRKDDKRWNSSDIHNKPEMTLEMANEPVEDTENEDADEDAEDNSVFM